MLSQNSSYTSADPAEQSTAASHRSLRHCISTTFTPWVVYDEFYEEID